MLTINPRREVLDPGMIVIADGRITQVGPDHGEAVPGHRTLDLAGRVILPGFVNTHAHLVSVLTRGLGGDRFLASGERGGRAAAEAIREALDESACYAGARLALSELLASGVTTTTDSQAARAGLESGPDGTLRALHESGMRAIFFRASVNRTEIVPPHRHDSAPLALAELDRLSTRWSSDAVTVGAEAMALHRVDRALLESVWRWSRAHRAPFAMHLSYSRGTARHPIETYGNRLLLLLDSWGMLDGRFLGYHPVWLDDAEVVAVARAGAGLALCSGANMLIGARPAPVDRLLGAGARLGIGTDQPNDGHNFFEAMKTTVLQQRSAAGSTDFGSPELMLELATMGGARALHLEERIGSIEVGKDADLVVLDARRPALNPTPGRISNVVYAASPADVEMVLVRGRVVAEGGRPEAWGLREVVEDARLVVAGALRSAGLPDRPLTEWPYPP